MDTPFLAMIALMGFNFEPRGWAFCNGQLLPISQNTALFSLLGTYYGGNGTQTFGLPDLRGRTAIGMGSGPGLSSYDLGQMGGSESITLIQTQMPAHMHSANGLTVELLASTTTATESAPGSNGANALGAGTYSGRPAEIYVDDKPSVLLQGASVSGSTAAAGGSQPHENRMPYLALNYVIALQGMYPSRN